MVALRPYIYRCTITQCGAVYAEHQIMVTAALCQSDEIWSSVTRTGLNSGATQLKILIVLLVSCCAYFTVTHCHRL